MSTFIMKKWGWRLPVAVVFFTVCLEMAGFTPCAFPENKELGVVKGCVKAKKAKYLRDTVVYIESVPQTFEPPKEHAVIDQKDMAFIPHVLPLIKGATVDFLNSDLVQHNVYSPDAVAGNMNLGTWLKGETRPFTFSKPGVASIRCNVHVDMLAYVLVLQNPYFARVGDDGNFAIANVPEGRHMVKVWNERYKAEDRKAEVKAGIAATVEFELK